MGKVPLVVAFGGGVNSAAMLIGMHERGIKPDLILFADTGGEKMETYTFIEYMSEWCVRNSFPAVTTVSVADNPNARDKTLEENCLRLRVLPSLAYGFKKCSQRWKLEPNQKFLNHWGPAVIAWKTSKKLINAIGIDAGEPHRVRKYEDGKVISWFPLVDWGWDRDACLAALKRHKICSPGKSACFFCPASKKSEVLWLKRTHPDLYDRAVQMERNAAENSHSIAGLGRHWSWESLGKADDQQMKLDGFIETIDTPCSCFDGEAEIAPTGGGEEGER